MWIAEVVVVVVGSGVDSGNFFDDVVVVVVVVVVVGSGVDSGNFFDVVVVVVVVIVVVVVVEVFFVPSVL